jgi:hypothetical protein
LIASLNKYFQAVRIHSSFQHNAAIELNGPIPTGRRFGWPFITLSNKSLPGDKSEALTPNFMVRFEGFCRGNAADFFQISRSAIKKRRAF